MHTNPRFLQGAFAFEGRGRTDPVPLGPEARHVVPDGMVAQLVYLGGRNDSTDLVYMVLMRDGVAMRHFPVPAHGALRVPLRMVDDLRGGTTVEVRVAAPEGLTGTAVIDLGMVEVSLAPGRFTRSVRAAPGPPSPAREHALDEPATRL